MAFGSWVEARSLLVLTITAKRLDGSFTVDVPESAGVSSETLNPKPYTLNPEPYTLHPAPYTPNPKSRTPNPNPQTLNPKP